MFVLVGGFCLWLFRLYLFGGLLLIGCLVVFGLVVLVWGLFGWLGLHCLLFVFRYCLMFDVRVDGICCGVVSGCF